MKTYKLGKFEIVDPKSLIKKEVNACLTHLEEPTVVVSIWGSDSMFEEGKYDYDVRIDVKNGSELIDWKCYKFAISDTHYMDVAHCENNILHKLWDEQNSLYTWAHENFGRRANVFLQREMVYA